MGDTAVHGTQFGNFWFVLRNPSGPNFQTLTIFLKFGHHCEPSVSKTGKMRFYKIHDKKSPLSNRRFYRQIWRKIMPLQIWYGCGKTRKSNATFIDLIRRYRPDTYSNLATIRRHLIFFATFRKLRMEKRDSQRAVNFFVSILAIIP